MAKTYSKIDVKKIVQVPNVIEQMYFNEETDKSQIVLHHTVSNPNSIDGDFQTWLNAKNGVSTPIIIKNDGVPYQVYSSKFWSHHLGIKSDFLKKQGFSDFSTRNTLLNKLSIGIEIDNWGGLTLGNDKEQTIGGKKIKTTKGKYYNDYGSIVNASETEILYIKDGFRGYNYFQKYTEKQIDTVAELLLFWKERWNINLKYNDTMWDVSKDALSGVNGVWTHVSYRSDKSDCFPQPELIEMLKSL